MSRHGRLIPFPRVTAKHPFPHNSKVFWPLVIRLVVASVCHERDKCF